MSEKFTNKNSVDKKYIETEKVYVPRDPDLLEMFRESASKRIVQPYLSGTDEPYSLRLRGTDETPGRRTHDATLKSVGRIVEHGKQRDEYSAPIERAVYDFYTVDTLPTVHKLRASPVEHIDIDLFDDGDSLIESEDPEQWRAFLAHYGWADDDFIDMTGQVPDNETRAHDNFRRLHGREAFRPYRPFDTDTALESIMAYTQPSGKLTSHRIPVVRIYGRSGSGKSHHLSKLQKSLAAENIPSTVISTDDYNVGTQELTRRNGGEAPISFDGADVYDLAAARRDALEWAKGAPVTRRQFDFATSEPAPIRDATTIPEGSVLFVEGLWARHDMFDFADVTLEVDTPLATSIGQRIARDLVERPTFSDPSANLGYYITHAEPTYRQRG